jgi:hypothetical protein
VFADRHESGKGVFDFNQRQRTLRGIQLEVGPHDGCAGGAGAESLGVALVGNEGDIAGAGFVDWASGVDRNLAIPD